MLLEERYAEQHREHTPSPLQFLLFEATLLFRIDKISSLPLEMGWFGHLQRQGELKTVCLRGQEAFQGLVPTETVVPAECA